MITPSSIIKPAGYVESPPDQQSLVLRWRVAVLFTLAVAVGSGATARAWDDEDQDDVLLNPPYYILSEQQFDQMLNRGTTLEIVNGQRRVVSSLKPSREQMEVLLTGEIEAIARVCSLTETQKSKLQLAGRGDIIRFFDQVTDLRRKYVMVAMNQQQYAEAVGTLQTLRITPQFIAYQETSLFRKTLRTTLNAEQRIKHQLLERERQVSVVESALASWGRSSVGVKLTGETRQKFIDTLVNHGHIPRSSIPYGHYIVLLEAARLEHLLSPLLSETEWQTIEAQANTARRLEPTIRKSGQWPVPPTEDEDIQSETTKD